VARPASQVEQHQWRRPAATAPQAHFPSFRDAGQQATGLLPVARPWRSVQLLQSRLLGSYRASRPLAAK
jgi:hypothetical protein